MLKYWCKDRCSTSRNKKYNSKKTAYSTIQLSRGVDLSASGLQINPSTLVVERIQTSLLQGLESYDGLADSEINRISNDFAPIYVTKPGQKSVLLKINTLSITTPVSQRSIAIPLKLVVSAVIIFKPIVPAARLLAFI